MSFGDWLYKYSFHIQAAGAVIVGACVIFILAVDAGWLGEVADKCTGK